MIQTTLPIIKNRNGVLSILKIEVRSDAKTETGRKFLVIDWNMADTSSAYFSKYVHWTDEQINDMDIYIESNYDLSNMTREQKEYKKLQIALMIYTKTNLLEEGKTIYGLDPEVWEYTPSVTEVEGTM